MKVVTIKVIVNADVSDSTLRDIIGNITEHIDTENKFWKQTGMIDEDNSVESIVLIEGLTKRARDLHNRMSELSEMSHEISMVAEKLSEYDSETYEDRWAQVEAMDAKYQALFAETLKIFGGFVLIPEGHAFCETCDTNTKHRWTKLDGHDLSRCIPCYEG